MSLTSSTSTERRQYSHVREVFVQACDLLAPLVAENARTKSVSNFAMSHMLQEHFPELSTAEIHIVLVTAEKMHQASRLAK